MGSTSCSTRDPAVREICSDTIQVTHATAELAMLEFLLTREDSNELLAGMSLCKTSLQSIARVTI